MEGDPTIEMGVDELEAAETGIPASLLTDDDLARELKHLHDTRHEVFLHGPTSALQHHSERTADLELEYLRRRPGREVKDRRGDAAT